MTSEWLEFPASFKLLHTCTDYRVELADMDRALARLLAHKIGGLNTLLRRAITLRDRTSDSVNSATGGSSMTQQLLVQRSVSSSGAPAGSPEHAQDADAMPASLLESSDDALALYLLTLVEDPSFTLPLNVVASGVSPHDGVDGADDEKADGAHDNSGIEAGSTAGHRSARAVVSALEHVVTKLLNLANAKPSSGDRPGSIIMPSSPALSSVNHVTSNGSAVTGAAADSLGSYRDLAYRLLPNPGHACVNLSTVAHDMVADVLCKHVRKQLDGLPTWSDWKSKGEKNVFSLQLPTFDLQPKEYVTHVGEYLLTLIQHIEPYVEREKGFSPDNTRSSAQPPQQPLDSVYWISLVGKRTVALVVAAIRQIPYISEFGARQLVADVDYLTNVLTAIGLSGSDYELLLQVHLAVSHCRSI